MRPNAAKTPTGRKWVVVAAAIFVAGLALSGLGAHVVARNETERSRQSFETTVEHLASSLRVAVRHEENLLAGGAAVVMNRPDLTSADVDRWVRLARLQERYPELQFVGLVVPIPLVQLAAFSSRATTGVPGPRDPGEVLPPGERPLYCLIQASSITLSDAVVAVDYCAGEDGMLPLSIRDSGVGSYLPYIVGEDTWFLVQEPVYRDAAPLGTVAERRAAFIGWLAAGVDIGVVLREALQGYDDLTITMEHRVAGSHATFRSGPAPQGADTYPIDLHNGWTATVHRLPVASGILASGPAQALLVGGTALAAALAGLIMLQGTGRVRAEFQARHDSLSGLANRALVGDRADELVARSRRTGTTGAALYLDIDGFKHVNDSLGHDTGDRLLAAVSARLTNAVRQADTIGRVGGDEFVILLDGSSLDTVPELVAQRLLEILREPFDLGGPTNIRVSTSIGVAVGDRPTGSELIDDADLAMYAARRAGKDRYAVFHPEMHSGSPDFSAA